MRRHETSRRSVLIYEYAVDGYFVTSIWTNKNVFEHRAKKPLSELEWSELCAQLDSLAAALNAIDCTVALLRMKNYEEG